MAKKMETRSSPHERGSCGLREWPCPFFSFVHSLQNVVVVVCKTEAWMRVMMKMMKMMKE